MCRFTASIPMELADAGCVKSVRPPVNTRLLKIVSNMPPETRHYIVPEMARQYRHCLRVPKREPDCAGRGPAERRTKNVGSVTGEAWSIASGSHSDYRRRLASIFPTTGWRPRRMSETLARRGDKRQRWFCRMSTIAPHKRERVSLARPPGQNRTPGLPRSMGQSNRRRRE